MPHVIYATPLSLCLRRYFYACAVTSIPAPLLLCLRHTPLGPGPGLYAVQVPPATHSGPGPATFWTWCHLTPWTWSSHHAPQVPQSHTRWTWSTTQNCTAARYRPHQGQNTVTPRPNTPWTWSSHFLDVVPFHPMDLVQPPTNNNLFNNHMIKQLIEHAYEKNRYSHTPLRRTSQCPTLSHKHEGT